MRFSFSSFSNHIIFSAVLVMALYPNQAGAGYPFWIEEVESSQHYRIEPLRKYGFVYSDREYVFSVLPKCLEGAASVITANSDKFSRGPSFIKLHSEVPLRVYVGYDIRYRSRPDWLRSRYRELGQTMRVREPKLRSDLVFQLYVSDHKQGTVVLGGNLSKEENANNGMYSVILVETARDQCR